MAEPDNTLSAQNTLLERVELLEREVSNLTLGVQSLQGLFVQAQQAQLESDRFVAKVRLEHFSLWAQYHLFTQLQQLDEGDPKSGKITECIEHIRINVAEYDHAVWHSEQPLEEAEQCTIGCRQFCAERDIPLGV